MRTCLLLWIAILVLVSAEDPRPPVRQRGPNLRPAPLANKRPTSVHKRQTEEVGAKDYDNGDGGAAPVDDYDKPQGGDSGGSDYSDSGVGDSGLAPGADSGPAPGADSDCICVPFYQCKDGNIVSDGSGIIDPRKKPAPEKELPLDAKFEPPYCGTFHVCCSDPETTVTQQPYFHRCGNRNPSGLNSRILSPGGKGEADFGEWPWQVAVLKNENEVNLFLCGGTLIDKRHVLTVAHCVLPFVGANQYPLKARLGEWDAQSKEEFLPTVDYDVASIILHPSFRNASLWNDMAILKLATDVEFRPHIDTVCLPPPGSVYAGRKCVVTGWGKDSYRGGSYSNIMKEVELLVIDNAKCQDMLRKTRLGNRFRLHESFLCAGGEEGLDSCKGDGGGPLVCYDEATNSYNLAGLVAWGIDCGSPGVPGVYVKATKFVDWVLGHTGKGLREYLAKPL